MASWYHLNYDVRHTILEIILDDLAAPEENTAVGRPLKRTHVFLCYYAQVCKEWYEFFEAGMYRHLFITQDSLSDLWMLKVRQRRLVRYIWLMVELEEYDCLECTDAYPVLNVGLRSEERVLRAVMYLFNILHTWEADRSEDAKGLTLEISACSPSDTEHHFFNDLYFDTSPFDMYRFEQNRPAISRPGHGWRSGRRTGPPSLDAYTQTARCLADLHLYRPYLFSVEAVTGFVLRRQTRGDLMPTVLRLMLRNLPNLQRAVIEPWRGFLRLQYLGYEEDSALFRVISESLTEKLRDLTIFEDFNEDYNTISFYDPKTVYWPIPPEITRTPDLGVGEALAQRSQTLTRLAASYMIEAEHFFHAATECHYYWENLTTLFLTSRHLTNETSSWSINALLQNAGEAALNMPKLQTMHIWNGVKGKLCGFRYLVTERETAIQWRGHWAPYIDFDVIYAWKQVAVQHTRNELTVKESEIISGKYIGSHAVAMKELGVHEDVVHPVSFRQIRCETSRYWYRYY